MHDQTPSFVTANGIDFAYFEMGTGPLALCLHGYPDTAHTWRYLLPELAAAGYRAVAPFNRGYAPTSLDPAGRYQSGMLGEDANALHEALGGDAEAVIIGHDWGAHGAYSASVTNPDRWRAVVAAAVPPGPAVANAFFTYEQLHLSWYMFFNLTPLAELAIGLNDYEFITKLWRDWSPGYDEVLDVDHFIAAMEGPDRLSAALGYYRQTLDGTLQDPQLAAAQAATMAIPPQPLLYLHGRNDGCMGAWIAEGVTDLLTVPGSRVEILANAGHFLQLEAPEAFNAAVLTFLS
jgi:pimeloyl-ACP methyl ester carboxylesterase